MILYRLSLLCRKICPGHCVEEDASVSRLPLVVAGMIVRATILNQRKYAYAAHQHF